MTLEVFFLWKEDQQDCYCKHLTLFFLIYLIFFWCEGLRFTTDPLFQVEKIFNKVKFMDLDPDKQEALFEAIEDWNSAMNMSNSMAFISQFGEYNPGGGKDEVLKYLNESQKQVLLAKKALETIMDALDLKS